jgi:hypothetical protein
LCSRRALALAAILLLTAQTAAGGVYLSKQEGLALAFPDADRIERDTFILTEEQVGAVEELAGSRPESRIVTFHRGMQGPTPLGFAFIDIHEVRTLPEALMVVLTPAGDVRSVAVLAFHEPAEYKPHDRWLRQFEGKDLSPDLYLKRDIHGITGATLTALAATRSVRRTLALWSILLGDTTED